MRCPSLIGQTFENLAQRVLYSYLCSYPAHRPVVSEVADEESQRQMHDFLWDVISALYADPTLLSLPLEADDWYEDWQVNNVKPELIKRMRKVTKGTSALYSALQAIGLHGAGSNEQVAVDPKVAKLKPGHLRLLEHCGISAQKVGDRTVFSSAKYPRIFPAWRLLAQAAADSPSGLLSAFSHCRFAPDEPFVLDLLSGLYDTPENPVTEVDAYMRAEGYRLRPDDNPLVPETWGVAYLDGDELRLIVQYDSRKRNQLRYQLRLTKFKAIWQRANELDASALSLLHSVTRPCRSCEKCWGTVVKTMGPFVVQRDGEERTLCPWYPDTAWPQMDDERLGCVKQLLELQRRVLA